eukprot:TRINITY_DN130_c2_g1_i2.p1 TRINITY_DN130_c2_g1~~TRINITY_DN130_c2_g1_i2.p1  ORF type:complete len:180 (-),score=54.39 TRINITY_DN130_c2_g1_i2:55-540(-)
MATYSIPITAFCICFILGVVWVDLIFDAAAPEYGTAMEEVGRARAVSYYQGQRKAAGPLKFVLPIVILIASISLLFKLIKGASRLLDFISLMSLIGLLWIFVGTLVPAQSELLKDRSQIESNLPNLLQSIYNWHAIIAVLLTLVFFIQISSYKVNIKSKSA